MKKPEPHPIANRECELAVLGVIGTTGMLLSLKEARANFCQELVAVSQHGINGRRVRLSLRVWQQVGRRPPIDDGEWRRAERRMEGRVVAELGPWKPIQPIPGAVAGETTLVHADCLVDGLGLAIHLGMEGRAEA